VVAEMTARELGRIALDESLASAGRIVVVARDMPSAGCAGSSKRLRA
jgi:hypothetical protein